MAKKTSERVQKFLPQTPEGASGALAYLREVAKEGEWDSFDEFCKLYVFPMAANRLLALDRYNKKMGKAGGPAKKKGSKKVKAKAKSAGKPRKAKVKAAPAKSAESNSEGNHVSAPATPAE